MSLVPIARAVSITVILQACRHLRGNQRVPGGHIKLVAVAQHVKAHIVDRDHAFGMTLRKARITDLTSVDDVNCPGSEDAEMVLALDDDRGVLVNANAEILRVLRN